MKKTTLLLCLLNIALVSFTQVAINSNGNSANPSAILDVSSSNKGMLIPRVYLKSTVDNTTIPNPAVSLLLYNTNTAFAKGAGFYFNSGTAASPNWEPLQNFVLPHYEAGNQAASMLAIDNYSSTAASSAIKGYGGGAGIGVEGMSNSGIGVLAKSNGGRALEVLGKVKISGTGQVPGAGKVLTSDASGNATWEGAIAFSAVGIVAAGSEVIANNTYTKVRFANTKYDLNGNYSGPNVSPHSTFTVPVHGVYHFDVAISWLADYNNSGFLVAKLKSSTNGIVKLLSENKIAMDDQAYVNQRISVDVELQVGDQIFAEVVQSSGDYLKLDYIEESANFNGRLVIRL